MTPEEKVEEARRKAVEAQAKADRERELERRKARDEAAKKDANIIVHPPAQK